MTYQRWLSVAAVTSSLFLGVTACGGADADSPSALVSTATPSSSVAEEPDARYRQVEQRLTAQGFKVVSGSVGPTDALPLGAQVDLGCADGVPRRFAVWGNGSKEQPYRLGVLADTSVEFTQPPTINEIRQYSLCG